MLRPCPSLINSRNFAVVRGSFLTMEAAILSVWWIQQSVIWARDSGGQAETTARRGLAGDNALIRKAGPFEQMNFTRTTQRKPSPHLFHEFIRGDHAAREPPLRSRCAVNGCSFAAGSSRSARNKMQGVCLNAIGAIGASDMMRRAATRYHCFSRRGHSPVRDMYLAL